jgi:Trypsin-like peptidase domain
MRMRAILHILLTLAALTAGLLYCESAMLAGASPANETAISAAICPVVYSLDESSAERGYRYIFYGNAFFINKDGYLLTAAHVLSDFQSGGQPQILVRPADAPPRLVRVELVASDVQHDVAILRAVPNPFDRKYGVTFLPLSASKPDRGSPILAEALRPAQLKDPHSFDAPQEEKALADVIQYTVIPLGKGQPKMELFLFNHEVLRGQSGAPILSRDAQEVVGIVEGQWLHGIPLPSPTSPGNRGSTVGAAVPITYALPLLEQQHVSWDATPATSK